MKSIVTAAFLFCAALVVTAGPAAARPDAIWARSTNGAVITLDGVLNEPAWAVAESALVRYGYDNGIPGSGYKQEGGYNIYDTTRVTLKFLHNGNQLYVAFIVPDSSIGGDSLFNFNDGLLMALKDRTSLARPAPPAEYFYTWWKPNDGTANQPGKLPGFIGRWGNFPPTLPRTAEQIAAWDAGITVEGTTNQDTPFPANADKRWVVEMRFDVGVMGYDLTQVGGDIVEWNVSVYDCDWYWPGSRPRVSSYRAWWQGPWGNTAWFNEVRIFCRSDVTVASGPVPDVGVEITIPNADAQTAPVVDGNINDAFWASASSFDIRYGDDVLRQTYGPVGRWRAGQYQATVNGSQAEVLDPADATIKWATKGDKLYMAFDARDQVVQYINDFDRQDGFLVLLNDRVQRGDDRQLLGRRLSFIVGPTGQGLPGDFLPFLKDTLFGAEFGLQLKPGTTVDTLGQSADQGYTAELSIDLTKFGYPSGLGDRVLFVGVNHLDGDSYTPFTLSYGTRTWFWREYEGQCCAPWAYMQPGSGVGVDDPDPVKTRFALLGNYPNPFRKGTSVRYSLGRTSRVTLEVYDPQGRLVTVRALGVQEAGLRQAAFDGANLATGVYLYRLRMTDPASGAELAKLSGKALFVR